MVCSRQQGASGTPLLGQMNVSVYSTLLLCTGARLHIRGGRLRHGQGGGVQGRPQVRKHFASPQVKKIVPIHIGTLHNGTISKQ